MSAVARIRTLLSSGDLRKFGRASVLQGSEQLVNVICGLAVTVWAARALGPELFGVWSLCVALLRIALTIMAFGLDILVLRRCAAGEDAPDRFLAAVISVRFLNAVTIGLAALGAIALIGTQGGVTEGLLLVMLPALLLAPLEVLEFYFRARHDAGTPAIARIIAVLLGSGLKIGLLAAGASLELVGLAHTLQIGLVGVLVYAFYRARGLKLVFDGKLKEEAHELYRRGWPLFVTAFGYLVYSRTDVVMLAWLSGQSEAGIYAAAVRVSETTQLAPVILMTAASPFVFKAIRKDLKRFIALYRTLLTSFNIFFFAVAATIAVLSPWIINVLFGPKFAAAAPVLAIHVFSLIFIAQGVATEYWWIARKRPSISMWRTLAGAVTNVILNLAFIPLWGAVGAAIATVISVWVASFGIHMLLGPKGWHLLRMQAIPSLPLLRLLGSHR